MHGLNSPTDSHKNLCSTSFLGPLLIAAMTLVPLLLSAAESTNTDPTGTWKWKFQMQNGETFEPMVRLKVENGKLTGVFIGRTGSETPIQEAQIKGDEVSFTVNRERDGQKMSAKYVGKVSGDTINGKIETERNGEKRTREWDAKRDLANATGRWKWTFEVPNGPTFEPSVKLKQEGDKLSGALTMGDREQAISDGSIKDGDVKFTVLSKREDRTVTAKYYGKLNGDLIKGKWDSDWTGQVITRDWEAKRAKD